MADVTLVAEAAAALVSAWATLDFTYQYATGQLTDDTDDETTDDDSDTTDNEEVQ